MKSYRVTSDIEMHIRASAQRLRRESQIEKVLLGRVDDISKIFPQESVVKYARGAVQGDGVVATFDSRCNANYLYSLNSPDCVIATFYNRDTKSGAVIQFDQHADYLIDDAIDTAISKIGACGAGVLSATLSGGTWLRADAAIGAVVKASAAREGIDMSWNQWTVCPCLQKNFGVLLNLEDGKVVFFECSEEVIDRFHEPLLSDIDDPARQSPECERVRACLRRLSLLSNQSVPQTDQAGGLSGSDDAAARIASDPLRIVIHDVNEFY